MTLAMTTSTALAQRSEDEPEERDRPNYPVLQYTVALVFGGVALWSVLRSSRRGWTS